MHDQGPLPELKEGGPMAFLIGCTKIAKEYNDYFLTKCIEVEKKNKQKQHEQEQCTTKITEATITMPIPEPESPNTVAKKTSALPNKRPKQ